MSGQGAPASEQGNRPAFFLRVHPLQALLEAWLLGGLFLAALLSLRANLQPNVLNQGLFFVSGGAALWCAIRGRMPRYPKRARHWGWEALIALALSLSLVVGWGAGARLIWGDALTPSGQRLSSASLFLAASGAEFLVFRFGVYFWQFWTRLRRRHLLWSLTHMQVQVLLVLAVLYAAFFVFMLFLEGYLPSRQTEGGGLAMLVSSLILTILPMLSLVLAATLFVLAVFLPPTALFAYFLSRRTTRRLEALAEAAARLRQGDYATRVAVQGEDEVAQLQADFNAMAADLEQAMGDLQAERDRVTALLQARRELVASVSHELRTPIATVRGYLESNRHAWEQGLPEQVRHDLEVIENEIVRLQGLIDDLFTLSRAEVSGLALDIHAIDIGVLVRRQVATLAPLAWQSSRVEVVAEVPPDLPPALADEGRLEQVLSNLLRNGVRHTLPGGVVALLVEAEEKAVRIEVRDTGEGIAEQDLPHIWERFYRGRHSEPAEAGGAGLGLALVKELTEAMGGTATVESIVGEGSCFTVKLPRA